MTKYVFKTNKSTELDFPKGTHTFDCHADIEYQFNTDDVRIKIDDYYFSKTDIDQLIEFLVAVKEQIGSDT